MTWWTRNDEDEPDLSSEDEDNVDIPNINHNINGTESSKGKTKKLKVTSLN